MRKEENDAFNRLIKIIDTALLISNRVKLRAHYGDFGKPAGGIRRKLGSWHYERRNEMSLWFNDEFEDDLEPKSNLVWLIDSPGKHYDAPNYVQFKFGSNEKKFEEKINIDSWMPNKRKSPEHTKSKKLISARLNQCHSVLFHSDHEKVKTARDLVHDCQSIVDELGVYPLVEYGSRTLKALAEMDDIDEPLINCAITAVRTCCIIANDTLNKVDNRETLISDQLWATLYLIQDELANSTMKPIKPSDKQSLEKEPSFWDEFITEKQATVTQMTKDFKKWLIQLKSRASVIALNRFIDTIVENEDFNSFVELFAALKPSQQAESRVFPVLPPPRFNTSSVSAWATERANKRFERSIRSQIKYGAEYAKINGGAILLICRDVPREFSFVGDGHAPLAEFGVRLSY